MWGMVSNILELPVNMLATPKNSVSIGPGQTANTFMLFGFSSSLKASEKLYTKAYVEL